MTVVHLEDGRFKSFDDGADFWRYKVGVNVIPADTKNKTTKIPWKQYQESPIPEPRHKQWKEEGAYNAGMAIVLGSVWHIPQKKGLYLNAIDCDNSKAIEEICTRNGEHISVEHLSQWTLVEQHFDDPSKMHVLLYSHKPYAKKSNDKSATERDGDIPAIEVKSIGSILFCSPSIHKNGKPYEILGTNEPVIADDLEEHIDTICRKYGIGYLDDTVNNENERTVIHIEELFTPDYKVIKGNNRHEALLRVMESLLSRNRSILLPDKIKEISRDWNNNHCLPPLDEREFQKQWKSASRFVGNGAIKISHGADGTEHGRFDNIISAASETILSTYRFLTVEETKEILYYEKGVYIQGGEILIEKFAENMYGYELANRHLTEIKGHIMRTTYHKQGEIDPDIKIINLKNGLYNIETGEFRDHTPDYLSIIQNPVVYNPAARPNLFGRYLQQVLYPTEIRTAIDLMAYTLYKDNPFEIVAKLFGYGANGKSVFTGLLTQLHGPKNVSNVPLSSMLKNRFALSDLENKNVNIDTELSSTTLHDTAVLKMVTGRQPVRIERKNQRAYDVILHIKLVFSANKIPETEDESDAHFRREIILSFPNRFEDGKGADPCLLRKLTTEEEMSGIFSILMIALRRLLDKGIFVKEKTIEQRREKHDLAVNPIGYFKREALAEDSVESDKVSKETLYQAYKRFCQEHNLAVESKENLGKILKNRYHIQEGRESCGERRTIWKGVKLTEHYDIAVGQQTLIEA